MLVRGKFRKSDSAGLIKCQTFQALFLHTKEVKKAPSATAAARPEFLSKRLGYPQNHGLCKQEILQPTHAGLFCLVANYEKSRHKPRLIFIFMFFCCCGYLDYFTTHEIGENVGFLSMVIGCALDPSPESLLTVMNQ